MRRRSAIAVAVVVFLGVWWWLRKAAPPPVSRPPSPASSSPVSGVAPAPVVARRAMPPPALQLAKPASIRPSQPAAPGAIDGMVVDSVTGEGIAGAELTFSHDDGAYSTSTGVGGGFHFAPKAVGAYRLISLEAKGYVPFEREFGHSPVSFTSAPGKDVTGIVLRLRRGNVSRIDLADGGAAPDAGPAATARGTLFGRVFDSRTGAPIAAFAIAIWRREGLAADVVAPASFVDPAGAYEIDGLEAGSYEVSALAAGYARSTYTTVRLADDRVEADFALHSGARVTGTVTDDGTRQPLAGVKLTVEGRRGESPDLPVAPLSPEAETGPDGRFALEHVPPDAIGLQAEKRGYVLRFVSLGDLPLDGDPAPIAIALTSRVAAADASFELTGIGAVLRVEADALMVRGVVPNGGAFDAGLLEGDRILTIDGGPVKSLDSAIAAIRGPEGTIVTLRIHRAGRDFDVRVTRKLVRN
ncbi:MAG: carboxypeptidase regulatory-like domain-containing protein [Myxococcales bacterium]|nr:carboxypeptidase regulatory-like domain-containing protein [Myxococcales bacterium]